MKILALETSAKAVSAAVSENGRILASGYQDTGLTHSRTLMPIVEHILKNTDLKLSDMDAIAVAVGPGSFTGIRIGVSAAKGLAFSVDKPAVGVSTLAAMARNAAFADGLIVCAMDARRSQVYNANFSAENGVLTRLTPDRAVSLDELAEEIRNDPRPITLVGDGAHLVYARFTEQGIPCRMAPPHLIMQNATSVALEAEALAAQGKLVSAQELVQWVEDNKLHIDHWFTVDDLNYLKMGGRLSAGAAFFGSMLSIKPVMHTSDEGKLVPVSKVRGRKASLKALIDKIAELGIEPSEQVMFICHADCEVEARAVAEEMKARYGVKEVYINYIGPVIGSHTGPNTMGIFFVGTKR